MVDYPANEVLPHVMRCFPVELTLPSGQQQLTRAVYAIPSDGEQQQDRCVSRTAGPAPVSDQDSAPRPPADLLDQLLALVTANLGSMYKLHARAIYGVGRQSWQVRKRAEMETPGLVYVVYSDLQGQPLVFLSLLLTDEPELGQELGQELAARVLYLFEIHVSDIIRGQGLGTRLLRDGLGGALASLRRASSSVLGAELTVFSENQRALQLYLTLGMHVAAWSPQDQRAQVRRRTRAVAYESNLVTRPAYYILFWPAAS
ncbi:LAQU0S01e09934g1_1 [Lachancea quebecensis]|uniref:N-alpha-acetyltransferase 40 n=1 Tax=Lachancea quebecensis TaxID=1654605 RepID=A0A0N7MKW1_9SACH|nr:LAQU0S01e09934g1_1 [Lachancea quebecensis]